MAMRNDLQPCHGPMKPERSLRDVPPGEPFALGATGASGVVRAGRALNWRGGWSAPLAEVPPCGSGECAGAVLEVSAASPGGQVVIPPAQGEEVQTP